MSESTLNLDVQWRRWVVENHLAGTHPDTIVDTLARNGLAPHAARAALAGVQQDPNLVPARWLAQRLRKLESLLDAQQRVRSLGTEHDAVPRRSGLTRAQFLDEHFAANRPVVLSDLATRWPALRKWTPQYLTRTLRDARVEVMTRRDDDSRYEEHLDEHRTHVRFADYVAQVESADATNDFYLVANNHFFELPGAGALLDDIVLDDRFLDPAAVPSEVFFWYGPAGTVTPLHHDTSNVLLTQVRGRKRVTLIPALQSHRLYNDVAVYSPIDPEAPDLERYPRYAGVTTLTVTLEPGESLLIPVGWWHHVRSLDTSISISTTAFGFPNFFEWAFPAIDRW